MARWSTSRELWEKNAPLARQMRCEPTLAEAALWRCLRRSQLGVRFRRQHCIGYYVVDFYCAKARLIVELDGPIHEGQADDDHLRTVFLAGFGFEVLRFKNDEVLRRTDAVVDTIRAAVARRLAEQPAC